MLPEMYRECYQELQRFLAQLIELLDAPEPPLPSLQAGIAQLQEFFQQRVVGLESSNLEPPEASRVRSVLVEIDKQLRLLKADGLFLKAARQTQTTQQRLAQVRDRLQLLQRYCEGLLQLG